MPEVFDYQEDRDIRAEREGLAELKKYLEAFWERDSTAGF